MNISGWNFYGCRNAAEPTLTDLEVKVIKINEAIESIRECDLSEPTKTLAIDELIVKKANLKELMHKKVNEL